MKKIRCNECSKIWYAKDKDIKNITVCPFCSKKIQKSIEITKIDTLGKIIYQVISNNGLKLPISAERIKGFLSDIAQGEELRREVKMFSKTFTCDYLKMYRNTFDMEITEAKNVIKHLECMFIEEEGLSEKWARTLCEGCVEALKYYKGMEAEFVILAEVTDFEIDLNSKDYDENNRQNNSYSNEKICKALTFKEAKTGDMVILGTYKQDSNTKNEKKPIEWLVLDKKNGQLLLLSKYALAYKKYNEKAENVNWETCALRQWLNNSFYKAAFSLTEQEAISVIKVKNKNNQRYNTWAGRGTEDKIFLLSLEEVVTYFNSDLEETDLMRRAQTTGYAKAQSEEVHKEHNGNCCWWLRSPGNSRYSAAVVRSSGYVDQEGYFVDVSCGVRPVLWLNFKGLDEENTHIKSSSNNCTVSKQIPELIGNEWEKAECCRKMAESGNIEAMNELGDRYYDGRGVERDRNKAFQWYIKAAKKGNIYAQYNVGSCYEEGEGVKENKYEAFEWYMKAAERGFIFAQCRIGCCYYYGIGVKEDESKAFRWYMKAAIRGDAIAQYYLGECYCFGTGITLDKKKAFEWYMKAAEQKYAPAQCNIGHCYFGGDGVKEDKHKAFEWYMKAAEQNDPEGQYGVAWCYYQGEGVNADDEKMRKWLEKSANQGHEKAVELLGLLDDGWEDDESDNDWY